MSAPIIATDKRSVKVDGHTLVWNLPPALPTTHHSPSAGERLLLLGGTRLAETIVLISFFALIVTSWPNPLEVFWQKGNILGLVFALSGIATIIGTFLLSIRAAPTRTLADLQTALSKSTSVDIAEYADDGIQTALAGAASQASALGSDSVQAIHLFAALLNNTRVIEVFLRLEHDVSAFHKAVYTALAATKRDGHRQDIAANPNLQEQLTLTAAISLEQNFYTLGAMGVFLSFADPRSGCAPALRFLQEAGLHYEHILAICSWMSTAERESSQFSRGSKDGTYRARGTMNRAWTAKPTPYLNGFSRDLTQEAGYGHVVLSSPYAAEIDEMLTTLAGGAQRNVVIVASEGADTDSVLYALASRILEGNVPETLRDTRLLDLDVTRLLTSSGQAEQAVQAAVDEAAVAGNVVLVLPKVAVLAGTTGAAFDGSQVLANALSQHQIQVITLATTSDYHRYVEQNSLLSQELRKIELHTLTQPEVVIALESTVPSIEAAHQTIVSYPALLAAAAQAERYLPEETPPSGARNLLETAAKRAGKEVLVTADYVAKATEELVKVPVAQAEGNEADLLVNLEESLHSRVIGQNEAVQSVASFLRRARAGLQDPKRPVGSFLFVGPTGVGKTELAKAVSDIYFGANNPMLRLDMSEYADAKAIYRLIGAPQGSSNEHAEGGSLTQPLRDHGFRLILLDELEKAAPDVLNLFLQILDDGRVTENTGRTIPINNAIIVATSNVAARDIGTIMQGPEGASVKQEAMLRALETVYKPEFLNRFDAVIAFHNLTKEELQIITTMMLTEVTAKLAQQEITASFAPDAVEYIAQIGYDPTYGARPLRRAIEHTVEGALANLLLKHQVKKGDTLTITADLLKTNA